MHVDDGRVCDGGCEMGRNFDGACGLGEVFTISVELLQNDV